MRANVREHLLSGERATCLPWTTSSEESDSYFQHRNYSRHDSYSGFDVPGESLLWRGGEDKKLQPLNKRDDLRNLHEVKEYTLSTLSSRVVRKCKKRKKENKRGPASISPREVGRDLRMNSAPSTIGKSLKASGVWNVRATGRDEKKKEKKNRKGRKSNSIPFATETISTISLGEKKVGKN